MQENLIITLVLFKLRSSMLNLLVSSLYSLRQRCQFIGFFFFLSIVDGNWIVHFSLVAMAG